MESVLLYSGIALHYETGILELQKSLRLNVKFMRLKIKFLLHEGRKEA
jgi:hypothetical protein